uniref:Peptidoglycan recognition protein-1 n=1 Tax=Schmidtea mediterranea TaxID=79327 RepID=I1ZIL3_SCHMD|nr:peptidoglycan recognition protein-1 [Schmidtea mediterranea]
MVLAPILISFSSSQNQFQKCFYGTANKPAVTQIYNTGFADINSFYNVSTDHKEECNFLCLSNSECFATLFYNRKCSFFNTTDFDVISGQPYEYTKWKSCDTKKGYQPPDGRCEGLWITFIHKSIKVNSYTSLDEKFTEEWNCRKLCIENPLCGFVNRNSGVCSTIAKWPATNIEITEKRKAQFDKWTCIDDFKDRLQPDGIMIKPRKDKCSGIWKVASRNYTPPKSNFHGLHFQTQIFHDCLKECNEYRECVTSLYSVEYSFCILENIQNSSYMLPSDKMSFIRFSYECLKNDSEPPELNADEKRYLDVGMKCNKIVSTEKLFIAKDKCGQFPSISDFAVCIKETGKNLTITDSCLLNQTYWGLPQESVKLNVKGHIATKRMKIYTGLQSYWLLYSKDNLHQVHYLECRHFNASRPVEQLADQEIVDRTKWYALPPNGSLTSFTNKIINFDISASFGPYHSCRTIAACTDILRALQVKLHRGAGNTPKFTDIPYNFMVDDSGHIYECRGWHYQSASVSMYNYNTISIGYIGWFKFYLPNMNVLNSFKKLIEYADRKGYVEKDYNVYIHQDLGVFSVHENLVITIKNFYRYRGFLPNDCKTIPMFVVLINLSIILPFVSIAYLGYMMFSYRRACKKCCFLHNQDCQWQQIFPGSEHEGFTPSSKENYIIYELPTIISSKSHIKLVKLVRVWFINQFLESMNSRNGGSNLKHFLITFSTVKPDAVIYEANFKNNSLKDEMPRVVLCVNYDKNLNFFKNLIVNRQCICHYFFIEVVDAVKISIDIQIRQ